MGKILVIKGANFSENAVDTQEISDLTLLEWTKGSVNSDGTINNSNGQQVYSQIVSISEGATSVTMTTTTNRYLTFVFYTSADVFIVRNVITQSGMSAECAVPSNATKIRLMVGLQAGVGDDANAFIAASGLEFTGIDARLY